MWSRKDWLIFFAGGQFFHAFSHVLIAIFQPLPIQFLGFPLTPQLNIAAIILNALIMIWLLWWASRLK